MRLSPRRVLDASAGPRWPTELRALAGRSQASRRRALATLTPARVTRRGAARLVTPAAPTALASVRSQRVLRLSSSSSARSASALWISGRTRDNMADISPRKALISKFCAILIH